jgi:peptidoglycan/xylan/chitin deacetylase (PgdA/CDA1 family)
MKNNLILKLLIIFLLIIFFIVFFTIACEPIPLADKLQQQTAPGGTVAFSESYMEISDVNGGDIYPGEKLRALIYIINSGNSFAKDVKVDIELPDMIIFENNANDMVIDSVAPGESKSLEIPLEVIQDVPADIEGTCRLIINRGTPEEFTGDPQSLLVFGAGVYARDEIPIIGLHAIEEKIEIPIELSTFYFDVLCRTLKEFGFETITFKDLLDHIDYGRVLPEKSVIITSDDGFGDLYTNALPVLKKYGYKMTVFLVTDFIKDTDAERVTNYYDQDRPVPMRPMLIWPEVEEMDEYGIEFLSHSANHIHLGTASDEEFIDELTKSKNDIESHLGKPVLFFAWPYDNNSPEKLPLLPSLGYRGAVRYWGGIETISTMDLNNIKRVEFNSLVNPAGYASYLNLYEVQISSKIEDGEIKKGEEFLLEYMIKNNDDMTLPISSFELELPESIELTGLGDDSYLTQYPAYQDGIYMWVSDQYEVKAGEEISIKLKLAGNLPGTAAIRFRITAYNGYINAEDVEVKIE